MNAKLLEQFNNMDKMPIIEVERNGEWEIYTLYANKKGIGVLYSDIFIKWDKYFDLDEHIQAVYEKILEGD